MAELLAAKGYDVVAVARREARLKELQVQLEAQWDIRAHPLRCDLTDPEAARYIRDEVLARGLSVDVLVNNAGFVPFLRFTEFAPEDQLQLIRLLVLSPVELCRHLLPHMVEQHWGRVINITSMAAMMAGTPGQVLYGASKSFLQKFSEGLAAEYEPHGIHCTASVVGGTDTELVQSSGGAEWVESNPVVQLGMMRPEFVARATYAACARKKRVVVPGRHMKLGAFALVHSPPALRYKLSAFTSGIASPKGV